MVKHLQKLSAFALVCCGLFAGSDAYGQVTLNSSPYVQNFDNVGGGLPAGWSVKTGATQSSLGTDATFVTNATAWSSTSGQFNNRASLDGLTTAATSAEQSASSDRVIAVRQTGSMGDPGAAFVFTLANTTGYRGFSINFKAQELTNDGRTVVWSVDYGIGDNPTDFIPTGTTGTTSGIQSTDVVIPASSLTALDNTSEKVHIRIVALSGSTGGGSRDVFAIDDFRLEFESTNSTAPSLIAPTSLELGDGIVGTSVAGSYTLSGRNLAGDVTLTATEPFKISKSETTGFGSTITFSNTELEAEQTVYVRATSSAVGAFSGTITHTNADLDDQVLTVSANAVSPFAQNFDNCTPVGSTNMPGGWMQVSVEGTATWECTSYGRSGNAVQINGYSSATKQGAANEDWLISPELDLTGFNIPRLSFWTRSAFLGPKLKLMISSDYDGVSAPGTAQWTELNANFPEVGSDEWTESVLLLDAYKQGAAHIALVYTSLDQVDGSSRWTVDDFTVEDVANALVTS
ncbi:MAG: choice-of-anchor J domain-containing protein, partial [Hymenobacteraceae bacterium]|nr:choice-of-anchor J domain-containing protein [Hymenobacteraceae bacterium]